MDGGWLHGAICWQPAVPVALLPLLQLFAASQRCRRCLQALAERREREEAVSKAQMEVALTGGASWGFGEDAFDEDEDRECASLAPPGGSETSSCTRPLWCCACDSVAGRCLPPPCSLAP